MAETASPRPEYAATWTRGCRMPFLLRNLSALALFAVASLSAAETATPPATDDALLSAAQAKSELDRLYEGLQTSHYDLYARRPREEYDALHRHLREGFDAPVRRDELRRTFQRFVAFGNVAHARLGPPAAAWEAYRASGGKAFPLFLRVVDGRVFVDDDYGGVEGIAQGDEIVTVDGVPALEWLDRLRTLVSADSDYLAHTQIETQLPMLAWWQGGAAKQYTLEVATPAGKPRRLVVPARSRAEFEAARAARPPRFELDWNARTARITEGGIGYLRPGPFYDNRPESTNPWDPSAFRRFIDEAFASFIEGGAKAVLIDLRNNPGGDNSFSDPMIAWFADEPFRFSPRFDIRVSDAAVQSNAKRLQGAGDDPDATSVLLAAAYDGKAPGSVVRYPIPRVQPRAGARFTRPVYLLINRHSYSNTVLVAAIAQDYGFATVLGEETSDLASTYGAAESFTLPLTGFEVHFPKARILRPNGNAEARGVVPDIAIATPVAGGTTDVVLEQALRRVSGRGNLSRR